MSNQEPRPKKLAELAVRVIEKLWKDGERALRVARSNDSPIRARAYSETPAGRPIDRYIEEDCDPGYRDDVGRVACARVGRRTLYEQFCEGLRDLENSLVRVDNLFEKILGKAKRSEARRRMRQPGEGRCVACGEYMPGTQGHRIRDGFCPKHYEEFYALRRSHGLIRSDFIARVRRESNYDGRGDD